MSSYALGVLILLGGGCGAPGEPSAPTPPVAVAVTDLSAAQAGDAVRLRFTLPTKTISGDKLIEPPAVEVVRGEVGADGSPNVQSLRVVETVPGAMLKNDVKETQVEILDPVAPEETRTPACAGVVYAVRTRASKKRASANSNAVVLKLYPVPERISALEAKVTEPAIELRWSAPTRTSGGDSLSGPLTYRVYRGEIDPASAADAAKDLTLAKWRVPLALLGPAEEEAYRDTGFDFGKTYVYVVRSVVVPSGEPVESADSSPAVITPVDTFPPAAPSGLVAAVLPGSNGGLLVDLSWSINTETDLAGYRVYKSERDDARGVPLARELLVTPAVRDRSVQPGHRYWYTVTALDRAGNESAGSPPIAVDVAQP